MTHPYLPDRPIIVAIDGHSSCGKSTLAKALAQRLQYVFIDTGAMYRAVTLYFIAHEVDLTVPAQIEQAMQAIEIHFARVDGENHVFLNGVDVEKEIRTPEVSNVVSPVSALPQVRHTITAQQRLMGAQKGIVMEGRDIGTAVFPKAELKIFLTAAFETRVDRRWREMRAKGLRLTREEVARNLSERDHLDAHRTLNPLRQAEDALVLDNTHLNVEEQITWILDILPTRIGGQPR